MSYCRTAVGVFCEGIRDEKFDFHRCFDQHERVCSPHSTMQGRRMRCEVHVPVAMPFLYIRHAKENTTIHVNCECRHIAIVQRFPLLLFVSISPFVFGLCALDEASKCACVSEKEFRMKLQYKQM